MKSKNVAKMGGGRYLYKDIIRGIKIPLVFQIYSFMLSKSVRLVFYELSLSQGRRGLSYLEDCDLFVSVCVGGGGEWLFTVFLKASSSVQHTSIFERLHKILDREDECLTVSGQILLKKIPISKEVTNLSRFEHAQLTFIIRLLVVVALKSFILISGSS